MEHIEASPSQDPGSDPGPERSRRIMDLVLTAGRILLENGAEVFRVEQTMCIMANSFSLQDFHVYVLTNGIFASAKDGQVSEVRNIPRHTVHLARVDAVNTLSRKIAAGGVTLEEAEAQLKAAEKLPPPTARGQRMASALGVFCFATMFGGGLKEGLIAAVAGFLLASYLLWCERYHTHSIFQKMTGAALVSVCCLIGGILLNGNVDIATIGALMLLTPGMAFTMGIRDLANSDYLSGSIRMIDALLVGGSIAGGAAMIMALSNYWIGGLL